MNQLPSFHIRVYAASVSSPLFTTASWVNQLPSFHKICRVCQLPSFHKIWTISENLLSYFHKICGIYQLTFFYNVILSESASLFSQNMHNLRESSPLYSQNMGIFTESAPLFHKICSSPAFFSRNMRYFLRLFRDSASCCRKICGIFSVSAPLSLTILPGSLMN